MKIFTKSFFYIFIFVSLGIVQSGFKKTGKDAFACSSGPHLSSPTKSGIGTTTATLGATVDDDGTGGCGGLTERGIYWNTASPATAGTKVIEGGTGITAFAFSTGITLPAGQQIFYVGYAINVGGPTQGISTEDSFYTLSLEPASHLGSFTASQVSSTQIDLAFTSPTGFGVSGYIILRKTGADPTTAGIADGVAPAATDFLATVTAGATTYSDATASPGVDYHYAIIPYNFNVNSATYNYKTSAGFPVTTFTTCAPANITGIGAAPGDQQIIVSWNNDSCQDEVMIVVSTAAISTPPAGNGSGYTANLDFSSGASTVYDGGKVVYKGSTSPQTVTVVANGSTYNVKIFTRKLSQWSAGVNTTVVPCAPDDVTGAAALAGSGDAIISWSGGPTCGDEVLIAASSGVFTATTPTGDGSAYTAVLNFGGAGTAFDGGKVVYKGLASGQNVTGLTNGTPYNFKIFTRKGTSWSSGVVVSATPCAPANVTVPSALDNTATTASISWTSPTCGVQVMVVVSTAAFTATVPTGDGSLYTANSDFSAGGTAFDGGKVVYKGAIAGPASITAGLVNGTTYNAKIFTRKGTGWSSGVTTTWRQGPPTVSLLSPLNSATNVASNTTLVITFTENVKVSVTAPAAGSDLVTVNPGGITVNRSAIVFSGNQATITLPVLSLSTVYDVVVGATVAADVSDNDFAGITTGNWGFTTNAGTTVTAPTPGACVGVFTPVGNIVLTETAVNNNSGINSGSKTIVLKLSSGGFQFKPGVTGVSATGSGDITSITVNSVTFSTATFTVNFDASANDELDVITISGINASTDGSVSPGYIWKDAASTLAIEGVVNGATNLAVITNGAAPLPPTAPGFSAGTGTYCLNTNLATTNATITGSSIKWYSDALLTNQLGTGNSIPLSGGVGTLGINSAVIGSTTFYATQTTGCESPSTSIIVTIAPNPSADAGTDLTGAGSVCAGATITLGGSPTLSIPSVPGGYTYAWTSTDGAFTDPGNVPNPVYQVPSPGILTSYDYSVLITDANGCTGTDTKTVEVNQAQIITLTQPGSTNFSKSAPAVTLVASVPGGVFSGIGVVQTGVNTYKFDPVNAYDQTQPLPQSFPITYTVTVGACVVTINPIATMNLSDKIFDNLADNYCQSEHTSFTGLSAPSPYVLGVKQSTYDDIQLYVSNFNNFYRFYYSYFNYTIPSNFVLGPFYSAGTFVMYGGEAYRCLIGNSGTLPTTPGFWTQDNTMKIAFNGVIRNYYEGAYGGNVGLPTLQKQAFNTYTVGTSTFNYYEFNTNVNYVNCSGCTYAEMDIFVNFVNPNDIDVYYDRTWYSYYYYYPGDVVKFGGNYYKQNLTHSNYPYWSYSEQPNLNPAIWVNLGPTYLFDQGWAYHTATESGFNYTGQFAYVNPTPIVAINGLTDGQNICQVDVAGTTFAYPVRGVPPSGYLLSGTLEISHNGGSTWVKDGTTGILNSGINSGIATLDTKVAYTEVSKPANTLAWSGGANYALNANVNYGGQLYRSLQNSNFGNQPDISPTFWEVRALSVMIRFTYDPGTTGSLGTIHCTGESIITVILHDTPTVQFTGATPANGFYFCYSDPTAILTTNRSAIIPNPLVFSGLGIVDNLNGTAQFVPSVANPTGNSQVTTPVSAVYTDTYGCQVKLTNTYNVNPKMTAVLTLPSSTFCNEDTPFNMTGTVENFTIGGSVTGTGGFVVNYRDVTNSPASTANVVGTSYLFDPKTLYSISYGSVNNSTQTFRVNFTETVTTGYGGGPLGPTTCSNSTFINYAVKAPILLDIPNINGNPVFCVNDPTKVTNAPPPVAPPAIVNNFTTVLGNQAASGNFSLDDDNDFSAVNSGLNATVTTNSGVGTIDLQNAFNNSANPTVAGVKQIYIQYAFTGAGCTAPATIVKQLRVSDKPTIGFVSAPTPVTNSLFCYDAPVETIQASQTVGVIIFGYGIIDAGAGIASYTPKSAFDASVSAGGTAGTQQVNPITVVRQDANGCRNFTSFSYKVNALPVTSFTLTKAASSPTTITNPTTVNFCYSDGVAAINGNALSWYDLTYQTPTPHVINYGSFASPAGSFNFDPTASFDDAKNNYNANVLSPVQFDITYHVKDANGCQNVLSPVSLLVNPSQNPTISGLTNGQIYCSNVPNIPVTFSPFPAVVSQRTFTINGVVKNLASSTIDFANSSYYDLHGGVLNLDYTVSSGTGCSDNVAITINVLPSPTADFNVNPFCVNTAFPGRSIPTDFSYNAITTTNSDFPIANQTYTWTFNDVGGDVILNGTNQTHGYAFVSTYNPTLNVKYPVNSGLVCESTIQKSQFIGGFPDPDFSVSDVCEGVDVTKFVASNNPQAAAIFEYQWDFNDGASTNFGQNLVNITSPPANTSGTYNQPLHQYVYQASPYNVTLSTRTTPTNGSCPKSITKAVNILKFLAPQPNPSAFYKMTNTVAPTGDPTGKGYFVVEDINGVSMWTFNQSDPVSVTGGSPNAWNNSGGYIKNDQSYVNSPCFDLSAFNRPLVDIEYFTDVRPQIDGTALQYSTDGGGTWTTLGNIGTGLEWYDLIAVSSHPGGIVFNSQSLAWSRKGDTQWHDGRHSLSEILPANRGKVRFRVAFGSDPSTLAITGKGFSFKEFKIEERNRIVLAENYTNNTLPNSGVNNTDFAAFETTNILELVKLQLHAGLPTGDNINKQNSSDPNARASFYGLTNTTIPKGYIDGLVSHGNFIGALNPAQIAANILPKTWANIDYELRSLVPSPIDFYNINHVLQMSVLPPAAGDNNKVAVSASFEVIAPVTTGRLAFFIAIVEKSVGSNSFVLRKLLPDASGSPIALPLIPGQIVNYKPAPWEVKNFSNINQMGVIAFIQDLVTKEVIQAAFLDNPTNLPTVTTGLEDLDLSKAINVYPSPADHEMTIRLPEVAKFTMPFQMIDQVGKTVQQSSIREGEKEKVVNTRDLSPGIYILQIDGGNGNYARKKVMIIHEK